MTTTQVVSEYFCRKNELGVPLLPYFGVAGRIQTVNTIYPNTIVHAINRMLDNYKHQITERQEKDYTWKITLQILDQLCYLKINIFYDVGSKNYVVQLIRTYGNFLLYLGMLNKLIKIELDCYKERENYLRLTDCLEWEDDNHILKWLLNDFIKKEICTWIS